MKFLDISRFMKKKWKIVLLKEKKKCVLLVRIKIEMMNPLEEKERAEVKVELEGIEEVHILQKSLMMRMKKNLMISPRLRTTTIRNLGITLINASFQRSIIPRKTFIGTNLTCHESTNHINLDCHYTHDKGVKSLINTPFVTISTQLETECYLLSLAHLKSWHV